MYPWTDPNPELSNINHGINLLTAGFDSMSFIHAIVLLNQAARTIAKSAGHSVWLSAV